MITVDCGAGAHDALAAAREAGLDVMVLDHHAIEREPPALAHVNPNRPGDTSGLGHVCAAGVTFLFLVALNRASARRRMLRRARANPICAMRSISSGWRRSAMSCRWSASTAPSCKAVWRRLAKLARPGLAALAAVAGDRAAVHALSSGICLRAADQRGRARRTLQPRRRSADGDGRRPRRGIRRRARHPQSRAAGDREAHPRRGDGAWRRCRTIHRSCWWRARAGIPASSASWRAG